MNFASTDLGIILTIICAVISLGGLGVVVLITVMDFGPLWAEKFRKIIGK